MIAFHYMEMQTFQHGIRSPTIPEILLSVSVTLKYIIKQVLGKKHMAPTRRKLACCFTFYTPFPPVYFPSVQRIIYTLIKKAISTFQICTVCFIKETENILFRISKRYRNTRESLRGLEIAQKHSSYGLVFPLQFLVLPNFHSCFYNCMETRKMFSIQCIS